MSDSPSGHPEGGDQTQHFPSIDGYDVIDLVGIGGMGMVYEAIGQATGRRVALKVMLDSAMSSDAARQRFEREVEFIARLDHPNIVAVLDSGIQEGRHYCVMDFVDGQALDDSLPPGECDPDEALALIERIAIAVDYAHQRGVLHRDLKPTNILIDEQGEPRLLDFGLAKAIDPVSAMGGRSTISQPGQLIGTVAYMAPEQARGEIDKLSVRTDVYALGAMAYELLTGKLPVDVTGSLGETLNRLDTRDATKPSAHRRLDSDTDAILLKALEKNPDNRYATARELADDIRRKLDGYPIHARRIGPHAKLGRWIKRNKRVSTVAGIAIVAVASISVFAIVNSGTLTGRMDGMSDRLSAMIENLDPNERGGQLVTVVSLLELEAERLNTEPIEDNPSFECRFRQDLGQGFLKVREFDQAVVHLRRALELQEQTGVGGRSNLATIMHDLGAALWWKQSYTEAAAYYARALQIREAALGVNHDDTTETRVHLANTYDRMGQSEVAERMHRRVLAVREQSLGTDNEKTIASAMSLGYFLLQNDRPEDALPILRDATERIRALRGDRYEGVAIGLTNLGACLIRLERWDEAESVLQESATLKRILWGEDSDSFAWTLYHLALIAEHKGDPAAYELATRAAETLTSALNADHFKAKEAENLRSRLEAASASPD